MRGDDDAEVLAERRGLDRRNEVRERLANPRPRLDEQFLPPVNRLRDGLTHLHLLRARLEPREFLRDQPVWAENGSRIHEGIVGAAVGQSKGRLCFDCSPLAPREVRHPLAEREDYNPAS